MCPGGPARRRESVPWRPREARASGPRDICRRRARSAVGARGVPGELPAALGALSRSPAGLGGNRRSCGPVLFLDVDGVLHSVRCTRLQQQFARALMLQLVRAVQASGASIVLSTAWRTVPEARIMVCQKLHEYGLPQPVGRTPDFGFTRRPCEILTWVEEHRPSAWVAIDDMPLDVDPRLKGHFVKTNPIQGLTPKLASDVIGMFEMQGAGVKY